jgi:uncharacterized protein YjbI with pentapeptide repeats
VTPRGWVERLPPEAELVDSFPSCDEDGVELRDLAVGGARLSLTDVLEKPELVNLRLRQCDLAGVVAVEGRADRVLIDDCRLRGVSWTNGLLRDVGLRMVTGTDLSVRFSTLRRVVFRDCDLAGIDVTEAVLEDVRFERCRLPGAQFHRARVTSLRIQGCDLSGASGVEALAGASIHPEDVQGLAASMAVALGLKLEADA